MSDEREKPKRVMVTTRKFHTIRGVEHTDGEVYEVDEADVDNLVNQGMVVAPDAPAPAPQPPQPLEPMTT